jgi:outer membrane protein OmpA-like peptidoglycan-associated protein
MADGSYMKVYLDEHRVANAPNAIFPRTNTLFLSTTWARDSAPIMIGPLRVAAGGRNLYETLARDGRVATHGILFATNSDVIRPESTPTLKEIGEMLTAHADLRLSIEGHTDSDGDDAYNMDLSGRRAASVKSYLVQSFGIDAGRLETTGLGESTPVADNATPEGKQQNRRVELVKQGG